MARSTLRRRPERQVERLLRFRLRNAADLIERGVVVGFSGGVDSLALAIVLGRIGRDLGMPVHLVHVDHNLRPTSAIDAAAAADLAARLDLPFTVVTLPPGLRDRQPGVGIEEAARRERYLALGSIAAERNAAAVATAHHIADQAETVLLHALRGSGMTGLGAMAERDSLTIPWWPAETDPKTVQIWRPLLDSPKGALRAIIADEGLQPIEDPTNPHDTYTRNRIRNELLPLAGRITPGATASLARLATLARDDDAFLNDLATAAWSVAANPGGDLVANRVALLAVPVQRRVVARWIAEVGVEPDARFDRIEAVRNLVLDPRPVAIEIGRDLAATIHEGTLIAIRLPRAGEFDPVPIDGPGTVVDKGGLRIDLLPPGPGDSIDLPAPLPDGLVLRRAMPDDTIRGTRRTLREHIRRAGVPVPLRDHVLVIASESDIWWVEGAPLERQIPRIADGYAVAIHRTPEEAR